MSFYVEPVAFEDVRHLKAAAVKEHVSMANPPDCYWLAAFDERTDAMVGFTAIVVRGRAARFKSSYVLPEWRGQGAFSALQDAREELARRMECTHYTAFCTRMSLPSHLARGAKLISTNAHGYAYIVRSLEDPC